MKRYGIKSLLIEDYKEITNILREIEQRFKKRTIFISGSAEVYEPFTRDESAGFIHNLSKLLISNGYRIVNGFGLGVGSFVINGALEAIYSAPTKYNENQLILKPFPQFDSGGRKLSELWDEYRKKMISQCGISFFVFGNKKEASDIIEANGVIREFEISKDEGNICIPIGVTNYASKKIFEIISKEPNKYYEEPEQILPILEKMADEKTSLDEVLDLVNKLLQQLNR